MSKVWIEVALNGPWSSATHPSVPQTNEEIAAEAAACVEAGAAIVHVHTNGGNAEGVHGALDETVSLLERIKSEVDAIVYAALLGPIDAADPDARFAPLRELARRGLLDWAAFDPGTFNYYPLEPDEIGGPIAFLGDGIIGAPNFTHDAGAAMCAELGIVATYACYEPGFARIGAALHRHHPGMPTPVYRPMFSPMFGFGMPPREWAVEAWAQHLAEVAPGAPWMLAGYGVDLLPLMPKALELGAHIRVGVEDHPFHCTTTNLEWVQRAVATAQAAGFEPATPDDVRATWPAPRAPAAQ